MGYKKSGNPRSRITGFNAFHAHIVQQIDKNKTSESRREKPATPGTTPTGGVKKQSKDQRKKQLAKNLGHHYNPGDQWNALSAEQKKKWKVQALELNMKKEVSYIEDPVERYHYGLQSERTPKTTFISCSDNSCNNYC